MKKNFLFFLVAMLVFSNVSNACCPPDQNIVVMTEKVVVTSGDQGLPHKGSLPPLYVHLSGNTLTFGSDYSGCITTLLQDGVMVYSTYVDENGQVILPDNMSGLFELDLIVDTVTYWAELLL